MPDKKGFKTELATVDPWNEGPPRLTGTTVFGAGVKTHTLLPVAMVGRRPMQFSAEGLPEGLFINAKTGVIQGRATEEKEATVRVIVINDFGSDERELTVITGGRLALTPPLGWNSRSCWATTIDQEKVRAAAKAMVSSGFAAHGFNYINIDDGWQGKRARQSAPLRANKKFPDMAGLCEYVHSLGLRTGIYSTPWATSYGGYPGGSSGKCVRIDLEAHREQGWYFAERSHHREDVEQWAKWGIDYLKYDWFAWDIPETQIMCEALRSCGRDIVFSLSNTAPFDKAAHWKRLANCWSTSADFTDSWEMVSRIAFSQQRWSAHTGPGHYGDPGMLVVGRLGWGTAVENRLSRDEQITHMTMWSILSAPLILGCDLNALDEFTVQLTCNDEVLDINQDALGEPADGIKEIRTVDDNGAVKHHSAVYVKKLVGGDIAVAMFNRGPADEIVEIAFYELDIRDEYNVRNVWARKDMDTADHKIAIGVPSHGAQLLRLSKK